MAFVPQAPAQFPFQLKLAFLISHVTPVQMNHLGLETPTGAHSVLQRATNEEKTLQGLRFYPSPGDMSQCPQAS